MSKVRTSVLRVVGPNEAPQRVMPEVLSLDEATVHGSYLQILIAQRAEIVKDLPNEKGPAKAAMHGHLSRLSKEIEALLSRESDEAEGGADVEDGEFDAAAI